MMGRHGLDQKVSRVEAYLETAQNFNERGNTKRCLGGTERAQAQH